MVTKGVSFDGRQMDGATPAARNTGRQVLVRFRWGQLTVAFDRDLILWRRLIRHFGVGGLPPALPPLQLLLGLTLAIKFLSPLGCAVAAACRHGYLLPCYLRS
jgi:hypothetical protein